MSEQKKRSRPEIHLMLTGIAILVSGVALVIAMWNKERMTLTFNPEPQRVDETAILERANDSINFADSLLGFLQGVSVIASIGIAAGTLVIRSTIQNQMDEAREFEARTLERFEAREHELDEMEREYAERLQNTIQQTQQDISAVQDQARTSFHVLSLLVLAEQQIRAHNIDTAIRSLEEAYTLQQDNHAVNYLLGYLYTPRKQFDQAIEHLDRALALDPDFHPAVAARGLALRRKGDTLKDPDRRLERDRLWAEAESELLRALDHDRQLIDADGESYFGTLGGLYRRQNRYDAALEAYEQAHQVTPSSSYPIINLATLYQHQGQPEKAAYYFEQVRRLAEQDLAKDPRNYWRRADYAVAKLVLGDREGALAELHTILRAGADQPGLVQTFRETLQFLHESPDQIPGLDEMIEQVDRG